MNKILIHLIFTISLFLISNCSQNPQYNSQEIYIENRWCDMNKGLCKATIDGKDAQFICDHLNNLKESEEDVLVANSCQDIEIYINDYQHIELISTRRYGNVYRIGIGKYAKDDELTAKIFKHLKIKNWHCPD